MWLLIEPVEGEAPRGLVRRFRGFPTSITLAMRSEGDEERRELDL